jgi:hypothetical protein
MVYWNVVLDGNLWTWSNTHNRMQTAKSKIFFYACVRCVGLSTESHQQLRKIQFYSFAGWEIWRSQSWCVVLWCDPVCVVGGSTTIWWRQLEAIAWESETWCVPYTTFCPTWLPESSKRDDRSQSWQTSHCKYPILSAISSFIHSFINPADQITLI